MQILRRAILLTALSAVACASIVWGWDQAAQRLISLWGQAPWGRFWGLAAYWLGHGGVLVAAVGVVIVWAQLNHQRGARKFGLIALAVFVISGLAVQAMKLLAGRPRPGAGLSMWDAFHLSLTGGMNSFPSGHATTSFALAAVLAARFPRAAWPCYGLAVLVAMGRVVGGSHFPSDVLAGTALGLLVGWLSVWRLAPVRQLPEGRLLLGKASLPS